MNQTASVTSSISLIIVEVDDAEALAGELFFRTFGHPIPKFPRHFVALQRIDGGALRVACYIHYTAWGNEAWLCGGLCIDRQAYSHAEPADAVGWKRAGGIGEILLRDTLSRLTDRTVFGYCGDARQWQ
ncbi:MAG TPA: hypothetical protein VGT81_13185, partial [Casimicrobiaceae bacterium]|nr:hypothetical protein [Casimicrobiaceae bacterium]